MPLDPSFFLVISSSVEVHSGFASEHARNVTLTRSSSLVIVSHPDKKTFTAPAPTILSAVKQTLSDHGASSVTVVGHTLGAALALPDAVYFKVQLNASVNVRVIGYGMPRVGNQDFANWVDGNLSGLVTHVNNEKDPVPIGPGMSLGFHHPSGEVHIIDSGSWENCPGELFSSPRRAYSLVFFSGLLTSLLVAGQDNLSTQCIVGDEPNIFYGNLSNHDGPYYGIEMDC